MSSRHEQTGLTYIRGIAALWVVLYHFSRHFGGQADGTVPPDRFRRQLAILVDQRVAQGAHVLLVAPPPLQDLALDRRLDPYRVIVSALARDKSLPFHALPGATDLWTDSVHLSPVGYARLAWGLLPLVRALGAA